MSRSTTKKKLPPPRGAPQPSPSMSSSRGAHAARLRNQTRKQLGKHYRAKYGVR